MMFIDNQTINDIIVDMQYNTSQCTYCYDELDASLRNELLKNEIYFKLIQLTETKKLKGAIEYSISEIRIVSTSTIYGDNANISVIFNSTLEDGADIEKIEIINNQALKILNNGTYNTIDSVMIV